ncbi:hypothetical protein EK21DRAFT_53760, partial [Setomelanomma holmii]
LDQATTRAMARTHFHGWRMGILLGCCINYTMQVLSSPTRKDIDRAHAGHEHLDIGVLSVRNLSRISRKRLCLFILMGLSSIPIHLFYNSAVFYIGANNEYELHAVQLNGNEYNTTYLNNAAYDKIEGNRWLRLYDTSLVSYGRLVLAIDEYHSEIEKKTLTGKPVGWPDVDTAISLNWSQGNVNWTFDQELNIGLINQTNLRNISATDSMSRDWIRMDWLVAQPSSNDTSNNATLSLTFLIIVIVCNTVKLATMLWVVFMERKDYIVTLGDGASSFLELPDPTTERMCILSKPEIVEEVADAPHKMRHNDQLSRLVTQSGKRWTKQYTTYSNALNRDREVGSYFM